MITMTLISLKNKNGQERACASCIKLYLTIRRLWNRYGPLSYKITQIRRRYDRSIASYFVFFRFLFLLGMLMAGVFAYLLINHAVKTTDYDSKCLYDIVPCFLLYNTFTNSEALGYSITLVVFLCLGVMSNIYQLVSQDRSRRIHHYFVSDTSK